MYLLRNALLTVLLIAFVVFGSYIFLNSSGKTKNISSPVSTEIQTIAEAEEKEVKATSLEGGKSLVMKTVSGEGGITEYSFTVDNSSLIYSETLDSLSSMNLTYNSWSPDDKYIYIVVNRNGLKDAYVFNSSGENFSKGEKYMSVYDNFLEKKIDYLFDEATGWGGQGLVQLKTLKKDGSRGPNFWFEIPSGAVIQLAH